MSCEELDGGLKKVTFARTPIMSVYLLAFIVGEYDFVEATDANGVKIRVYTPVGKAEDGKFALDVSLHNFLLYFYDCACMCILHVREFSRTKIRGKRQIATFKNRVGNLCRGQIAPPPCPLHMNLSSRFVWHAYP